MHRLQFIDIHIKNSKCIQKVPTAFCKNQNKLDAKYSEYTEDGYEGQMVRNDAPYENKRSKNLLKRKEFITEEFNVVEVMEGQGNWAGYAKHFRLELGDGREFKSGVRGNFETLKELLEQEEKPSWVTCRYFEKTPDGIPRFPVVIDWGTGERTD
jgi:DNA ligase-1